MQRGPWPQTWRCSKHSWGSCISPSSSRVWWPCRFHIANASIAKPEANMNQLFYEIRHNPLLWLLVFVPVVFVCQTLDPAAHTVLFVLSVLAIVPLAALLSHA